MESAEYQAMLAAKSSGIDELDHKLSEVRKEAADAREIGNDDQRRTVRRRGNHMGPSGARFASAMPEYGRSGRVGEADQVPLTDNDQGIQTRRGGRPRRAD